MAIVSVFYNKETKLTTIDLIKKDEIIKSIRLTPDEMTQLREQLEDLEVYEA